MRPRDGGGTATSIDLSTDPAPPGRPAADSRALTAGSGEAGGREGFLDAVRAIALIRVIAWHAFGVAGITYFVAAMPAMFFVAGSLLVKSFRRRSARTVLADRFRRLLIPLWVFGLVAWLVMALAAAHEGTDLPFHQALAWLFPLVDPQGTAWEGGWLSSHLWYLRTLTWLLLASPLLLRAVRNRPIATVSLLGLAVFGLDLMSRRGLDELLGHRLAWGLGDLALYSLFFVAGFLHRDGALRRLTRLGWLAIAVVAGAAAVGWRLTQPVPLGVVNNSHPLHLFVGTAWLALAFAAQSLLTRLATSSRTGPAVRAIGQRALTIYLWHTTAIILALNLLESRDVRDPLAHAVGLVLATTLGILVFVRLFGWVEDLAARRSRTPVPRPSGLTPARLAVASVAILTVGLVSTSGEAPAIRPNAAQAAEAAERPVRRPPIPSKPPPAPVFVAEPQPAPAPTMTITPEVQARPQDRLDGLLQEWADETGAPGALAGIAIGGDIAWREATGTRSESGDKAVTTNDPIELASLTKLFTATLVHQAADAGLIDLRGPVPELAALPEFPVSEGITVEQLLDHTSGLITYRDTTQYLADPDSIADAVSAITASLAEPRLNAPGEAHYYSSTNYLILGLLLEQVSGRSFNALLTDTFIEPLRLRDTIHEPAVPGQPRGGTSGVITNLRDLLTVGIAIFRDHAGLTDEAYAHMTNVDVLSGYGPGTFGFCPCRVASDGTPQFFAIGYFGASTVLAHSAALDLTIAVDLVELPAAISQYAPVTRLFEMIEERLT